MLMLIRPVPTLGPAPRIRTGLPSLVDLCVPITPALELGGLLAASVALLGSGRLIDPEQVCLLNPLNNQHSQHPLLPINLFSHSLHNSI